MARGIWKGSLGFGLVTIGVELFNAESPERLDLDMLDKRDMSRIGYLKINKTTGKPVEASDIVKGYEVTSNRYVILTPDDIKEANPKATQTIDVFGFVSRADIPLPYYAKPYIVAPTKGSEKAYLLFRNVLDETSRVALANMVLRTRQYLAAVYPFDGALMAQLLRYDAELSKPADLGVSIPKGLAKAVRPQELAMAKRLVQEMTTDWDPASYRDEYRDDLLKLIKQRAKGAKPAHETPSAPHETKVIDLMEALRRSVGAKGGGGGSGGRTRNKPAARARPARRSA
jgi:DNA end-binding protein Ku